MSKSLFGGILSPVHTSNDHYYVHNKINHEQKINQYEFNHFHQDIHKSMNTSNGNLFAIAGNNHQNYLLPNALFITKNIFKWPIFFTREIRRHTSILLTILCVCSLLVIIVLAMYYRKTKTQDQQQQQYDNRKEERDNTLQHSEYLLEPMDNLDHSMDNFLSSVDDIYQKNEIDCWQGAIYIRCAQLYNRLRTISTTLANAATSSTTAPTITTTILPQLNNLQSSNSPFYQQYPFFIFIMFIIVIVSLVLLSTLIMILFVIKNWRERKYASVDNQWIRSDVLTFERMNNTEENADKNNMNRNIVQDKLSDDEVQSLPLYYECTYLEPCSIADLSKTKAHSTFTSMHVPPRPTFLNTRSHSNRHHSALPGGTLV